VTAHGLKNGTKLALAAAAFAAVVVSLALATGDVAAHDESWRPLRPYHPFRLPWSAGTTEYRDGGCPVGGGGDPGCGAHTGDDYWAVDISSMSLRQMVRAIGGGTAT